MLRRFAFFGVFLAACGGSAPESSAPAATSGAEEEESVQLDAVAEEPTPMLAGWQGELRELEGELDAETRSLSDSVDAGRCDDAGDLTDRICELADRICSIAEEHTEATPRCEDAEERCHRSRERVADECG